MKFLVDQQLPKTLVEWLRKKGYSTLHVGEIELADVADTVVWRRAVQEQRIVISKDEDFFLLATRPQETGRLLWIRLGNCRTNYLLSMLSLHWVSVEAAFASGQRIVEIR